MPHQKKYKEGTANRTMTFLKKDLDTLQAHTGYRETLTDHVQRAIKDYIAARGWDKEGGGEGDPPMDQPGGQPQGTTDPKRGTGPMTNEGLDPFEGLPDYLR